MGSRQEVRRCGAGTATSSASAGRGPRPATPVRALHPPPPCRCATRAAPGAPPQRGPVHGTCPQPRACCQVSTGQRFVSRTAVGAPGQACQCRTPAHPHRALGLWSTAALRILKYSRGLGAPQVAIVSLNAMHRPARPAPTPIPCKSAPEGGLLGGQAQRAAGAARAMQLHHDVGLCTGSTQVRGVRDYLRGRRVGRKGAAGVRVGMKRRHMGTR